MDLIIYYSNNSEKCHQYYSQAGIIEKALKCYDTDDILVKLNSVEILSKWGESDWNSSYLSSN
jgi:hypothetical protein